MRSYISLCDLYLCQTSVIFTAVNEELHSPCDTCVTFTFVKLVWPSLRWMRSYIHLCDTNVTFTFVKLVWPSLPWMRSYIHICDTSVTFAFVKLEWPWLSVWMKSYLPLCETDPESVNLLTVRFYEEQTWLLQYWNELFGCTAKKRIACLHQSEKGAKVNPFFHRYSIIACLKCWSRSAITSMLSDQDLHCSVLDLLGYLWPVSK
jgi:hypothetical protein